MKYCSKCNKEVDKELIFCPMCMTVLSMNKSKEIGVAHTLRDMGPIIDKLKHQCADIGKINAIETKNGSIIHHHTPNYDMDRKCQYWDAIYQRAIFDLLEKYPDRDIYVAWYLNTDRYSENGYVHAIIIVPIGEFLSWFEDTPTDKARNQDKWSFYICENISDNSYKIKIPIKGNRGKFGSIDITKYLNQFELFIDRVELERLIGNYAKTV